MTRSEARALFRLLERAGKSPTVRLSTQRPSAALARQFPWAPGRPLVGAGTVTEIGGTSLHLLLVAWNDTDFNLCIFDAQRQRPLVDIRQIDDSEGDGRWLRWRYAPRKRDGRNNERIEYFARHFREVDISIRVPEAVADVADFLDEIELLAESRSKADVLDPIAPHMRETFREGRMVEQRHLRRERNPLLVRRAKAAAQHRDGRLVCAVCDFDFAREYGEVGAGYIEAHHTGPLSDRDGEVETSIEDLALVCANCHRMLHRRRPWLSMEDLRKVRPSSAARGS